MNDVTVGINTLISIALLFCNRLFDREFTGGERSLMFPDDAMIIKVLLAFAEVATPWSREACINGCQLS